MNEARIRRGNPDGGGNNDTSSLACFWHPRKYKSPLGGVFFLPGGFRVYVRAGGRRRRFVRQRTESAAATISSSWLLRHTGSTMAVVVFPTDSLAVVLGMGRIRMPGVGCPVFCPFWNRTILT